MSACFIIINLFRYEKYGFHCEFVNFLREPMANYHPLSCFLLEIASSETLQHVRDKINDYWLVPNRCEDVIVIKLGKVHRIISYYLASKKGNGGDVSRRKE